MAIFRLQIAPVSRNTGRTATSAAAYRAGERIRDERTGALYDHSKRADVLHKEIFLPSQLERADVAMEWARDRSTLWNTAEKAERMTNSRVAREYQIALPPELSAEQRVALARTFSREVADRYHVAVDLAIHAPRPEGDPRNFHAHLLATTREVTQDGLGAKTGLDMLGTTRSELGLPEGRKEFTNLRARWAELTNEALREANVQARVDHRSLAAQGIDREPRPQLPWAALVAERRGERSEIAEGIRERHRKRFAEQREVRQAAAPLDMDARRQQAVRDWLRYRGDLEQRSGGHGHESSQPLSMDEIRQRAVTAWRSLQARGAESQPPAESRTEREAGRDRGEADQSRETPDISDG